MLKQNKTFDLDKERVLKDPNNQKYYEPKNFRYSRFFLIPILIALTFLCIIVNADFMDGAYNQLEMYNHEKEISFKTIDLEATNLDFNYEEKVGNQNLHDFPKPTGGMNKEVEGKAKVLAKRTTITPFNEFLATNHEVSLTVSNSASIKNKKIAPTKEVKRNVLTKLLRNINHNTSNESKGRVKSNHRSLSGHDVKLIVSSSEQYLGERKLTDVIQNDFMSLREFYTNRLSSPAKCIQTTANCSLYCSNGGVNFIDESLESLKYSCPNTDLSLLVQYCEFTYGILAKSFFWGYFTLKYLDISDSNLQTIQSNAFKETNVKNLQTLILRNNMITTMTASTFEGVSSLRYFEFVQQPLQATFLAEQFLQPMAGNLSEAFITQFMGSEVVLNPRIWLQGAELSSLIYLNMANNNFQGILDGTTFRTLIAIENLNLSNCSLLTVPETTFDVILSTLKYLDLRWNYLQTLDLQLLTNVASHQIQLDLSANKWYCDCESKDMIEFLQDNTQLIETVVCYTPEKWQNVELKYFLNDCEDSITTIISTTEDSTTLSSAEIKDDSTTELSTVTETTETDNDASSTTSPTELTPTAYTTGNLETTTPEYSSAVSTSTSTEISETTTLPTNSISVVCYDSNKTETIYWFQRSHFFFINTTSATSVTIQITQTLEYFNIIYFTNYNDYKNLTTNVDSVGNYTVINIKGLTSLVTYIFCLATTNNSILSPFDCRAHSVASPKVPWLLTEDKMWFISVIVISCLLFTAASIFVVYVTLRKHPTSWLFDRNDRANNINQKNTIISRKEIESISSRYLTAEQFEKRENDATDEISLYSTKLIVPRVRAPEVPRPTDDRQTSCPSYETSQHCALASNYLSVNFNRFHNTLADKSSLYISKHTVPAERAPYMPTQKISVRKSTNPLYTTLETSTVTSEVHFNRFQPLDNDPDYQTIDHYEVVNF